MSASLQQQLDEMRAELTEVQHELAEQRKVWAAYHEGKAAATGGTPPPRRQPSRRRPRSAPSTPRPSLRLVAPGGAA